MIERLARLQNELARSKPDMPRAESPSDEDFQKVLFELKRRKTMYLAAESELRFLQSCHHSELACLERGVEDREQTRLAAKNELRELKREVERELEVKQELYKEISRLTGEHAEIHDRCTRDVLQVQQLQADIEDEDHLDGLLLPDVEMPAAFGDDGALAQDAESVAGLARQQAEELAKEQRQELQAEYLRKTLRAAEANRMELERLESEARAEVVRLEGHAALEEEFGLCLPRITFNDSAGVVTLGWPSTMPVPSDDDVSVRTVSVEFDEHQHLAHARTHPSLELQAEERASVERDDLPRLLTLVWNRICQHYKGEQLGCGSLPEASEVGGA